MDITTFTHLYGLIGYPLTHSFSKRYFTEKYEKESISNHFYDLFPIKSIEELPGLIQAHPNLKGLNVTIPYKEAVLEYLDEVEEEAAAIGAVNTIKIKNGYLKGFNTDVYGFEYSLKAFLKKDLAEKALILGSGGAAKAVAFVLNKMGIKCFIVSRKRSKGDLDYQGLTREILKEHRLIINTTPLGMAPAIDTYPDISYHYLSNEHYLYDLVYNPEFTSFMQKGAASGAHVHNGLEMLHLQAEKAWEIWNDS